MIAHPYLITAFAVVWPLALGLGAWRGNEPLPALLLWVVAIFTAIIAWPT